MPRHRRAHATGAYDARWSTPGDTRYTHTGGARLLGYIDDSLAALAARYPDQTDTHAPLLAGFSLGASEILGLAVKDPPRFPHIALIEGAWDGWTDARVTSAFHHVLFRLDELCSSEASRNKT